MRKLLVLRGGALGDFIVTLPALAALRLRWPQARIELAGNASAAELARSRGVLDRVHSQHEARWSALFSSAPLPAEFAAWLGEFDLVLNYWPDPDDELRRRFPVHPRQQFLSASAMPECDPAARHYCAPLRELGIECRDLAFRLEPLPGYPIDEKMPTEALRDAVFVHPGSGSMRKNWPRENWVQLIAQLPGPVALILGEAERAWDDEMMARVASMSGSGSAPKIVVLRTPGLETLVGYLSSCRLFLGHDSGISHLAAACGARCVLLFGPTDPARWAPPVPNVQVLRNGSDLATVSVDDVRSAVAAAFSGQT